MKLLALPDRPLFGAEVTIPAFETQLEFALHLHDARLHAFCWLPHEAHLAIETESDPPLRVMRTLSGASAYRRFRKNLRLPEWFSPESSVLHIGSACQLLRLVRYIHERPIHYACTTSLEDHPHSSHSSYVGRIRRPWLTLHAVEYLLGTYRTTYAEWMTMDTSFAGRASDEAAAIEPFTLERIIEAVAEYLHVSSDEVVAVRQGRERVNARTLVAWIVKEQQAAPLVTVAQRFSCSVSSLSRAVKRAHDSDTERIAQEICDSLVARLH